ncbi:MAG: 3-isopropylmalate dehydrogenase [Ignavibacteriae bacterium]|nr:3-isopropylmalate dehydrogenase [Ignavibacteriota bacterium]
MNTNNCGTRKIAIIPGDGIGIDVTNEATRVMELLNCSCSLGLELAHFDFGAEKYLATGISLPKEQLEDFRNNYAAIFLGALGDPRIPDMFHARDILFGMRFGLDQYVNMRPVKLFDEKLCPLKGKSVDDVNFVVFRENTEGLYVGAGGFFKKGTKDEVAIQESVNTYKGVERIIRYAFEYAKNHGLTKVTMSDKHNALRYEGDLWQRVFNQMGEDYPNIEKEHWFIDALAMQMIKKPEQFQVIVTNNMFGDIITDIGAQLQGGLGMAASGNINPSGVCMFEPVHGSTPKYAGKNVANPFGAILTVGLMLEHLGYIKEAELIEGAVKRAVRENKTTQDLGGTLGTKEAGDYICKVLSELMQKGK